MNVNHRPQPFTQLSWLIPLLSLLCFSVLFWFFTQWVVPISRTEERLGATLSAYIFLLLLIFSWQSMIEGFLLLLFCNGLFFTLLFATGDALSESLRLLVWSLLAASWYLPLFLFSLHFLRTAPQENVNSPNSNTHISQSPEPQQNNHPAIVGKNRKP